MKKKRKNSESDIELVYKPKNPESKRPKAVLLIYYKRDEKTKRALIKKITGSAASLVCGYLSRDTRGGLDHLIPDEEKRKEAYLKTLRETIEIINFHTKKKIT